MSFEWFATHHDPPLIPHKNIHQPAVAAVKAIARKLEQEGIPGIKGTFALGGERIYVCFFVGMRRVVACMRNVFVVWW